MNGCWTDKCLFIWSLLVWPPRKNVFLCFVSFLKLPAVNSDCLQPWTVSYLIFRNLWVCATLHAHTLCCKQFRASWRDKTPQTGVICTVCIILFMPLCGSQVATFDLNFITRLRKWKCFVLTRVCMTPTSCTFHTSPPYADTYAKFLMCTNLQYIQCPVHTCTLLHCRQSCMSFSHGYVELSGFESSLRNALGVQCFQQNGLFIPLATSVHPRKDYNVHSTVDDETACKVCFVAWCQKCVWNL